MKKTFLTLTASLFLFAAFAQSEKYMSTMKDKLAVLDTTHNTEVLKDLSGTFERIADAEKNQWLPYYYAALTQVNAAYMLVTGGQQGMAPTTDPMADRAESLLNKADALSKDNAEIYIVRKMIASLRLMADPMSRYMTYGPQAQQALDAAKKINPENPRIYILEGEDKFFTPEQFGGSKTEAKRLFELAQKKFETFRPESEIDPRWGRGELQYFLSQLR